MVAVMIGIDPHKASHKAVAISPAEEPLDELRVRAATSQAERLLAWAQAWPQRVSRQGRLAPVVHEGRFCSPARATRAARESNKNPDSVSPTFILRCVEMPARA